MSDPASSSPWPPPAWPPPAGAGGTFSSGTTGAQGWSAPPSTCHFHPGRVAGAVCRRCGRPICPDCMREAPVGWQCAACIHEDHKRAPVTRWRPSATGTTRITPITGALIVVNVLVWLWENGHTAFVYKYALVPVEVHSGHRWYQLITSAFLHQQSSITHIGLNMVSLFVIGPNLERALGRLRFSALYLLSALGGSVAYYLLAPPDYPGLGASGALFGLLGAWLVVGRLANWPLQPMLGLLGINLVISFAVPNIAWQAHLGGLVTGVVAAAGLAWTGRTRPSPTTMTLQAVTTCVALLVLFAVLLQVSPGHFDVGP